MMAIELATAYVSIVPETTKLEAGLKTAFSVVGKQADVAGQEMGSRLARTASKALKDGWRPDQDIMAGIPNTKLDRIGANIGQVIGRGVVSGLRANEAGRKFGQGFSDGASSVGLGKVISGWKSQLGGVSLTSVGALAGKSLMLGLTGAATLGVGTVVGGLGTAITKGFDRLLTIDKSKQKLKALGKSTAEVADIVKTVTDSVTGTPFSLDGAFATAVQAIGAGSQDIGRFMKNVADAAGFAGTDIERMGLIFNQVLAKGKLTGEEMMQLMEAGLPVKSWIQQSYNLTTDQFDKMQQKGEITLDMLQRSIEAHAPGMAQTLGDSLQGSIDKMQTAIARLGADFLAAIFGGDSSKATDTMADSVQKITDKLNSLDGWVKNNGPQIQQTFKTIGGAIQSAFKAGSDAVASFMSDMKILADGLQKILGMMASFDEFISKIPGMGDSSGEAKTLRQWQKSLQDFANPPMQDLGGGPNASRERRGLTPAAVPSSDILTGSMPAATIGGSGNAASTILGNAATGSGLPNAKTGGTGTKNLPESLPAGKRTPGLPYAAPANMSGNKAAVYQAMIDAGFTPNSFDKLDYIIMHESQYSTTAKNPATGDWGIPQFNPGVGNIERYLGGYNTDPYVQGSGMMRYIKDRYGTIEDAYAFKKANGWYSNGGGVSGPGTSSSDSIPAWLSNGEHVLSAADVAAMGGQNAVYQFRNGLHRANGGDISKGQVPWVPGDVTKVGPEAGNRPDINPGSGYPGVIGLPDWGTPGTRFGPPPADWWQKPINPDDILFPDWMPPGDRDRWLEQWGEQRKRWKLLAGYAEGGQPLSEQDLAKQMAQAGIDPAASIHGTASGAASGPVAGVDPNTVLHGLANGSAPGPQDATGSSSPDYAAEFARSMGFVPTAGSNTGYAGTSSLAQVIKMPSQFLGGLMDTAANLGSMAVSAAIAAGAGASGGSAAAGYAASPALSYGFSLLSAQGKEISNYWLGDLPAIAADAAIAQMFPFGAPRWLGYDYTQFAPQLGLTQAATTTLEKMGSDAINKYFGVDQNGNPVPSQHGQSNGAPPGPAGGMPMSGGQIMAGNLPGPEPGAPPAPSPSPANVAPPPPDMAQIPPPNAIAGIAPQNLIPGLFDNGGMLPPGGIGVNMTNRPEPVLTSQQWDAMNKQIQPSGRDAPLVKIDTIYGMSPEDVASQIESKQKLAMMRYSGRP